MNEVERLNPVCPVCGEDEPLMRLVGHKLVAVCRRCGWGGSEYPAWIVEPLSKPWEES